MRADASAAICLSCCCRHCWAAVTSLPGAAACPCPAVPCVGAAQRGRHIPTQPGPCPQPAATRPPCSPPSSPFGTCPAAWRAAPASSLRWWAAWLQCSRSLCKSPREQPKPVRGGRGAHEGVIAPAAVHLEPQALPHPPPPLTPPPTCFFPMSFCRYSALHESTESTGEAGALRASPGRGGAPALSSASARAKKSL